MDYKILIIEDDLSFGIMLQEWLNKNGYETFLSPNIERAKKEIQRQAYNLILSDLRLPDGDGTLLLEWMKKQKKSIPIILMTSYAEIQSAVMAIKLGAFDYLEKPINPSILKQKIEQALDNQTQNQVIKENKPSITIIQGDSQLSKKMYEKIKIVAPTRMSVLIFGESGSGKEHVARLIHENSSRKGAPFIAVDCGSLLRELALSELFGHVKGAFTSAIADKKGVFEQANRGTVFLDEIGNLPYEVQIQLLRTLQEQLVHPIGSSNNIKVDVRILAATNEDLETAIANGRFREDLYHRLKEFVITVPALRERAEDIPIFAEHFLKEANQELDKQIKGFSPDTLQILEQYHWPGNLRELRNVIRNAVLFAQTDKILPENLPTLGFSPANVEVKDMPLWSANEKEYIEAALKKANGNKQQAAKLLKISRKTLYNKMHLYGIKL